MSPELQKRVMTGVVGGAVLLGLIIFGGWPGMFLLTTIISLGMLAEYGRITLKLPDQSEKFYAILCLAWFMNLANVLSPRSEIEILTLGFLVMFAYFLGISKRHELALAAHFRELVLCVFGLVYLVMVPLFLPRIHQSARGVEWTIVFLLINWAGDTGAYFAGKRFGRNKLYPIISPKKTREGAYGGLAASFAFTLLAKLTFFRPMPWAAVIFVPPIVGAVAQVGDFCESLLKRAFEVKDSGSILPGHGGFLDRFDGVVFSLPVMYACVRAFS